MNFDLLAPYIPRETLSDVQRERLRKYLDLLMRWNAKTNLTSLRSAEEITTRHFGESLFAASHLVDPGSTQTIIDFGSGAGFPGLPLKIFAPGLKLALVESQNKKVTFLREVIRALQLTDAEVYAGRGEQMGRQATLVTMRAVEKFESAAQIASSLVEPGGRLALLIGEPQVNSAGTLLPDFAWANGLPIPGSHARTLLVGTRR